MFVVSSLGLRVLCWGFLGFLRFGFDSRSSGLSTAEIVLVAMTSSAHVRLKVKRSLVAQPESQLATRWEQLMDVLGQVKPANRHPGFVLF